MFTLKVWFLFEALAWNRNKDYLGENEPFGVSMGVLASTVHTILTEQWRDMKNVCAM